MTKRTKRELKAARKAGEPIMRKDGRGVREKAAVTGRVFPKMKRFGRYMPHQGGGQAKLAKKIRTVMGQRVVMTPDAAAFLDKCRDAI